MGSGLQQKNFNNNNTEYFNCEIPKEKLGNHVLYQIWQRDDSPEAFYSCSDVNISLGEDSNSNDENNDDSNNQPNNNHVLFNPIGQIFNNDKCVAKYNNKLILKSKDFCNNKNNQNKLQ